MTKTNRSSRLRTLGVSILAAAVVLVGALSADASPMVLNLSDYTPASIPASWLDAEMVFTVSGNTLTLDVTNKPPDPLVNPPESFKINTLHLNASDNVTGMTLVSPAVGWTLGFGQDAYLVGGLGRFDIELKDGVGQSPSQIYPGQTLTFVLNFTGVGVTEADFTTEHSAPQGSQPNVYACAKFISTGSAGSAEGAAGNPGTPLPEPATIAFFSVGVGAVLAGRRARMRRQR